MATWVTILWTACVTPAAAQSRNAPSWAERPHRTMDSILTVPYTGPCEVNGLPDLDGMPLGNIPVRVVVERILVDSSWRQTRLVGRLVQRSDPSPLSGARLAIGTVATAEHRCQLTVRAGTVTDEDGNFDILWAPRDDDVLIVSVMGHLEAAWQIGVLGSRTRPVQERNGP